MPVIQTPRPVLVKRFARSRLYDTVDRRYVSTDDLRDWAEDGTAFRVVEAETGEDITRLLLA